MTQEEILQAAKDADAFYVADKSDWHKVGYCVYVFGTEDLERFAAIIEKRTIERCADIADRVEELADALNDKISDDDDHNEWRSEYVMGKAQAANRIAATIRKLGEQ